MSALWLLGVIAFWGMFFYRLYLQYSLMKEECEEECIKNHIAEQDLYALLFSIIPLINIGAALYEAAYVYAIKKTKNPFGSPLEIIGEVFERFVNATVALFEKLQNKKEGK